MQALMLFVALPLLILNMLAGLVGGIWLGVLGEWGPLLAGVAYMVGGALALGIVMMPTMILAVPAANAAERGHVISATLLGIPIVVWTYLVLTASCVFVFSYIVRDLHSGNAWPLILWGYAVVVAPWSFLARKDAEAGNDVSSLPLFFAQLGTIAMMVVTMMERRSVGADALVLWFAPFIAIAFLLHLITIVAAAMSGRRF